MPFYVVASPSLIGQKTSPESLDALAKLPLSVLIDRKNGRPWPWLFANGQTFTPKQPALICDDPDTELEATLAGMCFGQIPAYLAEHHLRSGKLVAVLADLAPAPWDLFIYR
ncbi:LysR substrate-binding domain-containing protein, partial [Methylophaga sp. UBA1918]|uniref:LysR substrate-binding domain-containing protein n=1 Tax=Methylophaga sp. UBA1918 TaxID=1946869 RepID=UPI00259C717C